MSEPTSLKKINNNLPFHSTFLLNIFIIKIKKILKKPNVISIFYN